MLGRLQRDPRAPSVPVSALADVIWPAVPPVEIAQLLCILHQLAQSERWNAETLLAHQIAQAERLLRHARTTVPFYRDRLAAVADGGLTLDLWRTLPLLTRDEVQAARHDLVSRRIPPEHGNRLEESSSGSTGRAVTVVGTSVTALFNRAFDLRKQLWHGRDFGAKAAVIRALPPGAAPPPAGARGANWAPGYATGPLVTLNLVGSTTGDQLDWLGREAPAYLMTFPSNLEALARRSIETGAALPSLKGVATFGEHLDPELHDLCRRAWNVALVDTYSATEVGPIAIQCPRGTHYHVQAEGALVEIIDAAGRPCGPGEIGRVIATDLHNFAMPLLRYEVGDYAEVGSPCACGRGLPVLTQIMGRARNMLKLPNGERLWPRVGKPLRAIAAVRQHQLIQRTLVDLEVKLVTARPLTPDEEAKLRAALLEYLGHPFRIAFDYVAEIPRPPNQKFEWVRCEVA